MNIFNGNKKNSTHHCKAGLFLLLFVVLNSLSSSLFASDAAIESHITIQQTAKEFLEEMTTSADNPAIEVSVKALDKRLTLRKCDEPISASLPVGAKSRGKVLVSVSCRAPVAWKVFVSGSVDEYADVVVATRTIPRKSAITKRDVMLQRTKVSPFRQNPMTSLSNVIGASAKRQIRKDMPIFEKSICMVCRGDSVQITARSEFFSINMEGIALSDASIGDMTSVRNTQSKRSFNAKVISKNKLEVSLSGSN
jgi:flagella basal body P-ring formation protein FlgA